MAKNNMIQQNKQKNFLKNKALIQKAKDNFGNKKQSVLNKKIGEEKSQNQSSHDNFFLKSSKSYFKPKNQGIIESKVIKNISFDKNKIQSTEDLNLQDQQKHPFDKKLYRLKKYSNKFKVQQWEEKRKKVALHSLKRIQKSDGSEKKFDVQKIYEEHKEDLNSDSDVEEQIQSNNQDQRVTNVDKPTNITEQRSLADKFEKQEQQKNKKGFKKAQQKFQDIKAQKLAQREDFLRKKQEKEEALKVYQKKKTEKYKKLSMKTKKGQPVMKGRMQLLLEQIQNSIENTS